MTAYHHQGLAATLSKGCRDLLVEHVDGSTYVEVPVVAGERKAARQALLSRGLIRFRQHSPRPTTTYITDDGRQVLCHVLADYIEALMRATGGGLETPALMLSARARAVDILAKPTEDAVAAT